jgi:hypothetical protein
MTSRKYIDVGDACFDAYVILDIIQPKKISRSHLWQEILVVILDLNAVQLLMNKRSHARLAKWSSPVMRVMLRVLEVNLICGLGCDIPPARILLLTEGEKVGDILLVPILDG